MIVGTPTFSQMETSACLMSICPTHRCVYIHRTLYHINTHNTNINDTTTNPPVVMPSHAFSVCARYAFDIRTAQITRSATSHVQTKTTPTSTHHVDSFWARQLVLELSFASRILARTDDGFLRTFGRKPTVGRLWLLRINRLQYAWRFRRSLGSTFQRCGRCAYRFAVRAQIVYADFAFVRWVEWNLCEWLR